MGTLCHSPGSAEGRGSSQQLERKLQLQLEMQLQLQSLLVCWLSQA